MTQQQDPSWLAQGWTIAEWAFNALTGILAALWLRMTARVESLEKTAVTRDELNEKFAEQREDRKSMHVENKEDINEMKVSLRRIEDKFDAIQPGVLAAKLGQVEEEIQSLRKWRHQVEPFIERRVDP